MRGFSLKLDIVVMHFLVLLSGEPIVANHAEVLDCGNMRRCRIIYWMGYGYRKVSYDIITRTGVVYPDQLNLLPLCIPVCHQSLEFVDSLAASVLRQLLVEMLKIVLTVVSFFKFIIILPFFRFHSFSYFSYTVLIVVIFRGNNSSAV